MRVRVIGSRLYIYYGQNTGVCSVKKTVDASRFPSSRKTDFIPCYLIRIIFRQIFTGYLNKFDRFQFSFEIVLLQSPPRAKAPPAESFICILYIVISYTLCFFYKNV